MNKLTHNRNYFKPFNYPWAFELWERHESAHWLPKEVPLHDDLKDWDKLPEKDKSFLTNIFRFFVQGDCYHKETDILTNRGFIKFSELTEDDLVAQVVYQNGEFVSEFVKPVRTVKKMFNGDMMLIADNRRRTKQCVTPTHDIVYTYKGNIVKEKACDAVIYQNKKFHNSAKGTGSLTKLTPFDRLRIAFQADGNVKKDVDGSKLGYIPHRFAFKKQRKADRLRNILFECGLDFVEKEEDRHCGKYFEFYVKGLAYKLDKNFDWVDISKVDSNWCKEFLIEAVEWDGTKTKHNRYTYTNTNTKALDVIHAVGTLAGLTISNRSIKNDDRSDKFTPTRTFSWRIDDWQTIDGQSISKHTKKIPYNDYVYCVTVPSGMIITRYDYCTAISGNCDVADGYVNSYLPFLPQPEVRMMLLSFAAREAVHIVSYSHLIESLGMPDSIYEEFSQYKEMVAKHDFFEQMNVANKDTLVQRIAAISAFTEGVQLFSSFAMLLNYPRHGKMKGMGQIISWSQTDEQMHCEGMIRLFRTHVEENRHIWKDSLKKEIYDIARKMVELEDAFIDLCFSQNEFEGMTSEQLKQYIRYIADRRLLQLGLKTEFKVKKNPLPWIDEMINAPSHGNFFETRVTDYAKAQLQGSWSDVFK
jgi:ribonucleoside-diphosphate reductase beta chain